MNMKILGIIVPVAALVATIASLEGACNDVGDCPVMSSITPGGACSGDSLECPYTLQTPSPSCDGTDVDGGLATSCICSGGSWACPAPVDCDGGGSAAEDGGVEAGVDAGDDAGGGDSAVDGGGDGAADGGVDAARDSGVDGATDGGLDSGGDAAGDAGDAGDGSTDN